MYKKYDMIVTRLPLIPVNIIKIRYYVSHKMKKVRKQENSYGKEDDICTKIMK